MSADIPTPTAAAIAAHAQAYEAFVAAIDRVQTLRLEFNPELRFEDELSISRAMVTRYGHRFREMGEAYREAERASTTAAEAEDRTWLAFRAMVPTTAAELREWVAYVIQHSGRMAAAVSLIGNDSTPEGLAPRAKSCEA